MLAVLLASVMLSVRIDVLLSYYSNDLYSALQVAFEGASAGNGAVRDSGIRGFWFSMIVFVLLATTHIVRTLVDLYLMQRFIIAWRVWLTHRLTGDWLDGRAYYRGRFLASFHGDPIDNPDQRIQQDVDVFTTGTGPETNTPTVGTSTTLLFGAVNSIVSVVAFTPILWNLSGPLTILGVTVPKALFWIALLYVFVTTVVAFWIGRPLIRLSFANEATNAAFRYALVRLRDAAEAVGFYRGEASERKTLSGRFAGIIANYRAFVRRGVAFLGWNLSVAQIIDPLPLVVQAPRLFAAEITLGDVTQSSSAFRSVHDSLSFFRAVYDSFASYRAAIIRLDGLITANETARELPSLTARPSRDGSVELDDVKVHPRWGSAGRPSQRPAGRRRVHGDHGRLGLGQDDTPAQPRAAVAVHLGHTASPRRRHDVLVADAVRAAGRLTIGDFVPGRHGRIRRRGNRSRARHCDARSSGEPPGRGGGLGQSAVPR
jgi:putative ATP-binding cassette transporter